MKTATGVRRINEAILILVLFSMAACASSTGTVAPAEDFEPATVMRVVDGDTLAVSLSGTEEKVRLINVNAAESVSPDEEQNTPEGEAAAAFVKSLVKEGDVIWLQREVSDRDKFGRLLRHVWLARPQDPCDPVEVSDKMLDALVVRAGFAKVIDFPPDTAYSDVFADLERGFEGR